ncbi:MAG: GWxTD domain-containing protein [Candidatus Kapaibacteriota bacterium]
MEKFCSFFFLLLITVTASSQPDFDVNYLDDYRKSFNFQPIYFASSSGDSIDVFIPFRFTLNYLTFQKANDNDQLFASFLLEFVFRDENGIIKRTFSLRDSIYIPSNEKYQISIKNYINFAKTIVPLQNYVLEVSLFDLEKTKIKTIRADISYRRIGNMIVFNPIYASKDTKFKNRFVLSLLNNALDFRRKDKVIIIPIFASSWNENFTYKIKSSPNKTNQISWQKEIEFKSHPILYSTSPFSISVNGGDVYIEYEQKAVAGSKPSLYFNLLEFPEHLAYLQDYELKLKFENINDTINYNFKVVWDNPPLSLKNINYAIELMYYIITDTTYEHLLGLKRDQQWNEFFEIWRKFDTDTSTLFNEAMDEYYRRVDFAFLNFQTITEADGAKTDRGKIFILFGKPSYTQRIIDKDGNVLEYWFYYSLKKKFTFATKYKKFELVEIKDL